MKVRIILIKVREFYSEFVLSAVQNGMLHHSLGGAVIFYFFAALYFALIDLLPCLQARGTRIAIRNIGETGDICYKNFEKGVCLRKFPL